MSDTELSIFDDKQEATETPQEPQEAAPETVEAAPEPEAPAEPQVVETGEPEAAPPVAEAKEEPHSVPITAMLDEREKRQEIQRQFEQERQARERLEAQIRQQQEAAKQPQPDWFEDPQGAMSHQMQTVQQQMQSQKLQSSQFFAEREYGKELVEEATKFFDENPQLSGQFLAHPSPWHSAVEFYKKQAFLKQVGDDPAAWEKQKEEEIRQRVVAEMAAQNPTPTPAKAPPTSLTRAAASGGNPNETAVSAPPGLNHLFNG